jgi:hypothetical protein
LARLSSGPPARQFSSLLTTTLEQEDKRSPPWHVELFDSLDICVLASRKFA